MTRDGNIITELKVEFKQISETLISIKSDIKELVAAQHLNNTEAKLLKQDLNNTNDKIRSLEKDLDNTKTKVIEIENKQSWLLAKVGTITTVITGAITWFLK